MLLRRHRRNAETKQNDKQGHETKAQQETKGQAETGTEQRQEVQTESLEDKTVPELKEMAKAGGFEGYSNKNKGELLELLGGE